MKVNTKMIKALRQKKLWSQDELALAAGLSLRTIQRAEGDQQASPETLKALASVFEVDVDQLIREFEPLHNYINVQLGYTVIIVTFLVAMLSTWTFTEGNYQPGVFVALMVVCAGILSVFCTLTTRVEDGYLKWNFGIGLITKKLPVSRIISNQPVRNKLWWGVGIRLIPGGWLYNVSGLSAVELILDDEKRVRIGSDEAEKLNQAINQAREKFGADTN